MEQFTELDKLEHKKVKTAFWLCFFLGVYGAHRFYQKKWGTAILYLFTFGCFGIGWIIDCLSLAIKLQYFCEKKRGKNTTIKQIRNWTLLLICILFLLPFGAIVGIINSEEDVNNENSSINNTEVKNEKETQSVILEDEQLKIEFINKCQTDLSYSDPETSFGEVYDVIKDELRCNDFSYNGLAPTAGFDLINVFVTCEEAEGFFDYDEGYNIIVAFDNEKIYYIVFDNKTFWENGEVFYDYSYIKEYHDMHYVSYSDGNQIMVDAQFVIENYLLIPKSAKYSGQKVGRNGDLYVVTGIVESMNSFGVMIPYEYIVEFQGDNVIYVRIGDQSYGEYILMS